nr:MAG TPA: hypothetical protein [Caudoviricetes sp.]
MKNIFQKNPSYNPTILQINFLFSNVIYYNYLYIK